MTSKQEMSQTIERLRAQLKEKREKVQKYVAVTHIKGDVVVDYESVYIQRGITAKVGKCDKTIVLVRRDDNPDTILLDGKWTIENIKEAAA